MKLVTIFAIGLFLCVASGSAAEPIGASESQTDQVAAIQQAFDKVMEDRKKEDDALAEELTKKTAAEDAKKQAEAKADARAAKTAKRKSRQEQSGE